MKKIAIRFQLLFIGIFLSVSYAKAHEIAFKILDSSNLSVEIIKDKVDFGQVKEGERNVAGSVITIINNGDVFEDFKLSLDNPSCDIYDAECENDFKFFGVFHDKSVKPDIDEFSGNDLLTPGSKTASQVIFAVDSSSDESKGWGVPSGKERSIFFRFDAPESIEENSKILEVNLCITAVASKFNKKTKKIGFKGGKISLNGGAFIDIPAGALKNDVEITFAQLNRGDAPQSSGLVGSDKPLALYEFKPAGLKFRWPVEIALHYSDYERERWKIDKNHLKVFWWDGFQWTLIGGTLDDVNHLIKVRVNHFSMYAVFPVARLNIDDYRPNISIITPSVADNINDYVIFNGLAGYNFEINIYDITGRKVKEISDVPQWDGTDEFDKIVESGIYIYQLNLKINGESRIISGTIAVAK